MFRVNLAAFALLAVCLGVRLASGQDMASDRQDLVDAILGRKQLTTLRQTQLDRNGDRSLDVADLIALRNSELPVACFVATRSGVVEGNLTHNVQVSFTKPFYGQLEYSVLGGTATLGADCQVAGGTVTVAGASAMIPVQILDDSEVEGPETVLLTLVSRPDRGYLIDPLLQFHCIDLHDDDNATPSVFFETGAAVVAEREVDVPIRILTSRPFGGAVQFTVQGSAVAGVDYTAPASPLNLGQASQLIIHVKRDEIYEGAETVEVSLQADDGFTVEEPSHFTLTIQDIEARFEQTRMVVDEGSGVIQVPVVFNYPYTGTLKFSCSGSAIERTDFNFPEGTHEISVNGRNAVIPIQIVDDLDMESTELVALDLEFDMAAAPDAPDYDLCVPSRFLLLIQDNDTVWTGVLRANDEEEVFQMEVRTDGTQTLAALISSSDPEAAVGQASAGTIPDGRWAVAATWTAEGFTGVSDPMPVGSVGLFGHAEFRRRLEFSVLPGHDPYLVQGVMLLGSYRSFLDPVDPDMAYLARQRDGVVVFVRGVTNFPMPEREMAQ